jgi:tRNA pseudouridine32 synthase/23S rRNA pseudouridine746 synthase
MLPIVFVNSLLVVVDKPAGWLSVPSRLGAADGRPCVGIQLQAQLGCRLWPTHRLDEEVAGLLLFARSADAHRLLCGGFEAQLIHKTYRAECTGAAPADAPLGHLQRWTTTLLRGKKRAYVHPAGKPAVTDVRLLRSDGGRLHFELKPRTGRPHQLRVELARRGCPIVGDALYGSVAAWPAGGIALRAVRLAFDDFPAAATLGLPRRLELDRTPAPATDSPVAPAG